MAIPPSRALYRRQQHFRLYAADMRERVFEHSLLDRDLCSFVQMLKRAAAA
jgi:hypothetical protein